MIKQGTLIELKDYFLQTYGKSYIGYQKYIIYAEPYDCYSYYDEYSAKFLIYDINSKYGISLFLYNFLEDGDNYGDFMNDKCILKISNIDGEDRIFSDEIIYNQSYSEEEIKSAEEKIEITKKTELDDFENKIMNLNRKKEIT